MGPAPGGAIAGSALVGAGGTTTDDDAAPSDWAAEGRWRSISYVDVNGDGRMDICGRLATGYECRLSNENGVGPAIPGPKVLDSYEGDWNNPEYFRTLRFVDIALFIDEEQALLLPERRISEHHRIFPAPRRREAVMAGVDHDFVAADAVQIAFIAHMRPTLVESSMPSTASGRKGRQLQSFGDHVLIRC